MIKKLQEYHQKLNDQKQAQAPKDDIRSLLKERKKNRLENQTLPSYAKIVDDQLEVIISNSNIKCTICGLILSDSNSFKIHIPQPTHQTAIQELKKRLEQHKEEEELVKRRAQTSIESLQHELGQEEQREPTKKSKRLTREQIERINKEIDQEFIEEAPQFQQKQPTLPENFFENIEQEMKEKFEELAPKQEDEEENPQDIVAAVKSRMQKPIAKKPTKTSKFDYLDALMDEENDADILKVEWKEKKFT